VYDINATSGDLESVTDTNGNKLTYPNYEISYDYYLEDYKSNWNYDRNGRMLTMIDALNQNHILDPYYSKK
jgi:hypothetical protein